MSIKKSRFLAPVILLALLTVAFRFDEGSVHWLWSDQPIVAVILGTGALVLGIFLVRDVLARKTPPSEHAG